ncbi:MAG: carcinine hydrolase/isopenicillin-N N-acyltransferase family protein [Candidatus Thorarchaeota archaeon]
MGQMLFRKLVIVVLAFALLLSSFNSTVAACTIFSASNDEMTLVGNNEDWEHNNFSMVFYPEDSFGFGHVAFVATDDYLDIRAGMNTEGVFIDSTAVRASNVTIDSDKEFIHMNFFKYILWTCSSVNETIEVFQHFNIAETWFWQVLVADRYGESVVIVAGSDETVWYIRGNETYQLITNGNIAYPELGQSDSSALRYYLAENKLNEIGDNLTITNARDVLDAAHSDWTAFSTVCDLVNRNIYIYFNHDYTKEVIFNLDDELAKGGHYFEIHTLFQDVTMTDTTTASGTTMKDESLLDLPSIQILAIGFSVLLVLYCTALVAFPLWRKNAD